MAFNLADLIDPDALRGNEPGLAQPNFGPLPDFSPDFSQQGPGPDDYTPDRSFGNVLRDVLGTFGDALIMRDGGQPVYTPNREQRKYSRALGDDFAQNPLAAIRRLQQAGFGQQAQQMQGQIIDREKTAAQIAAQEALVRQRDAQVAKAQNYGTQQLAQLAQGVTDQASLDAARARNDEIIARYGLDPSVGLPTIYDPASIASYIKQGISPYQTGQLDLGDRRITSNEEIQTANREERARAADQRSSDTRRAQDITATTQRAGQASRADTAVTVAGMRQSDRKGRAGSNPLAGAPPAPAANNRPLMKGGEIVAISRNGKWELVK